MSKQLLQEYFELCPEGRCPIDRLTESEKRNVSKGSVYLVGICQKAGTKNGNGRVYRKETLAREVENYQKAIRERRSLGELDHPDDSVINLKNASHLATKMWWDGDSVMAKFEVLDTPSGRILKGETIVEDDFQLICFDMVSEPSTPNAYLKKTAHADVKMNPEINMYLSESKNNKVDSLIKSILKEENER